MFCKETRREIGEILRTLCEWKKTKSVEAEGCPNRVHLLGEIPSKGLMSSFMEYLKGNSSLIIHENIQTGIGNYSVENIL